MRLKIALEVADFRGADWVPINYQYVLASALYKIIEKGDSEYSKWLHDTGIKDGTKTFKFFTFSRLVPQKYQVNKDQLVFLSPYAECIISFYTGSHAGPFINGLFRDTVLELGDRNSRIKFRVLRVEMIENIDFKEEMRFQCLSPIVISYRNQGQKYPEYLKPDSPGFSELFLKNLQQKYQAYNGSTSLPEIEKSAAHYYFRLEGEYKRKGVTIKEGRPGESRIIGYDFRFAVHLPLELMQIGYYAGFGEKNSMGFGCVREW